MSGIRTVEQQFGAPTAQRIRALLARISALRQIVPGGATKYYLYELHTTLEAGALLAALHVASTSVELFIRAKIIQSVSTVRKHHTLSLKEFTYQELLEENKKLKISDLIDHLIATGLFRLEDKNLAISFYEEVRTPLAHGLLMRFTYGRPTTNESDILRLFSGFTGQSDIEDVIESCSLDHIDVVVELLERNATYRCNNDG